MKKILLFLCCALWCGVAYATEPTIGKPAPDFTLSGLLQAPANAPTKLSGLRGNIVVIDFWATWCSPCHTAMKNLSALAEKFTDKPIRFLSITSEKRDRIERFLKSSPNKLWMGLDSNRQAFNQYDVRGIPHTVIVDKSGKLIAITNAEEITEERINALLAGKEITFKRRLTMTSDDIIEKEFKNIDTTALPSIVFKPCLSKTGMYMGDLKRRFTAVQMVSQYIGYIYQIPYVRMIDSLQSKQQYFMDIFLPQPDPELIRTIEVV
jgi:thiol-disulfide isomerase/thioredoxin